MDSQQLACNEALSSLGSSIGDMVQPVVTEFSKVYKEVHEMPEMKKDNSNDPELAEAVEKLKASVKTTMVHVRSFVIKVHGLIEYIVNEEPFVIKAVQERKSEELNDYLKEILSKSKTCQKDIGTLRKYIKTNRTDITHLKKLVEKRKGSAGLATGTAVAGGVAAAGGAGATVGGILGFTGLVSALSGPLAVVVIPVGVGVAAVGGITAAVAGTRAANYGKMSGNYDLILKTIKQLEERLKKIDETLSRINETLKTSIDNSLEHIGKETLDEIAEGKTNRQRAVVLIIQYVTLQVKRMEEFCKPLKEAATLEAFIVEIKKLS